MHSPLTAWLTLTWKARARMLLAAGTSPASHLDLAPMSHSTSALGQWATALCRSASRDSLQDRGACSLGARTEKTVTAPKFGTINDLPDFTMGRVWRNLFAP